MPGSVIELRVASQTDRGRVRDQNEDAVLAEMPLVAVADGMGGHEGGEVASTLALEILASWKDRLQGQAGTEATRLLREAFVEANRKVWEKGQQDEALSGMGTTLTAGWIGGDAIALAHVGDSRAYLLRGTTFQQLTEDQTVAQELARRGRISEDEAVASPHRHYLLQAIGVDPEDPEVEVASVQLRPGDRLLFATDGLYGTVKDPDRIRAILEEHSDPQQACGLLVSEANAAGGGDNISVVVIDALGDGVTMPAAPDSADPAVVIEKPTAAAARRKLISRIPRRVMVAGGAVLLAALIGLFAVSRLSEPQLLVAERDGRVAVLKGRPGNENSPAQGQVVRVFRDERVTSFSLTARRELRTGIPVDTMAQAEQVIANLPRLLGPRDTPPPTPEPSPPAGDTLPDEEAPPS